MTNLYVNCARGIEASGRNFRGQKRENPGNFPGVPVVKTPHFQCKEHRFDPWSGKILPAVSLPSTQGKSRARDL